MAQPYSGFKVVDLTHVLAGPFAVYQLAVLGAEVIKIENPNQPDQVRETGVEDEWGHRLMNTNFLTQGSNKRAITLDIKTAKGREVLLKLIDKADVFVQNYRKGALAKLGLGYEDLKKRNPNLIYCSLSGYGHTGPKGHHTAYDGVIQATSGLMSVSGTPELTPLKVGAAVVDYASGSTAAFAIASALVQRERNGGGSQHIDVSMLDAALMLLSSNVCGYLSTGKRLSTPRGNAYPTAGGSCFETKDGLLMLSAINDRQHIRLWKLLGREDYAKLYRHFDQVKHDPELRAELTRIFMTKTAAEWEEILNEAGVPSGRVRTLPETLEWDQVKSRKNLTHRHDYVKGVEGPVTVPVAGFSFEHGGAKVTSPPALMGEHTDEVLKELGYKDADIAAMRAEGVV